MRNSFVVGVALAFVLTPISGRAAEQTVVLAVHHADYVLCGPIVKKSLERVTGVKTVTVSQADAMADVSATVTFDDRLADAPALIAATTKAGYPANVAN